MGVYVLAAGNLYTVMSADEAPEGAVFSSETASAECVAAALMAAGATQAEGGYECTPEQFEAACAQMNA